MIKFLDLQAINERYNTAFKNRFDHFLTEGYYILGTEVSTFETKYAEFSDAIIKVLATKVRIASITSQCYQRSEC